MNENCKHITFFAILQSLKQMKSASLSMSMQLQVLIPKMTLITSYLGAIKFVLSGANIMCPGLTHPNATMTACPENTVVAIFAEGMCLINFTDFFICIQRSFTFPIAIDINFNVKMGSNCKLQYLHTRINSVVEFPGAGLGRLTTINSELNGAIQPSEAATEAGRASVSFST